MKHPKVFFTTDNHKYTDEFGNIIRSNSGFTSNFHEKFSPAMKTYKAIKSLHGVCDCPKVDYINRNGKTSKRQEHAYGCSNLLAWAKKKFLWNDPKLIDWVKNKLTEEQNKELVNKAIEWGEKWDKERDYGTDFHEIKENKSLVQGYEYNPMDDNYYLVIDKPDLGYDNYYILPYVIEHYKQNIYIPECVVFLDCKCPQKDEGIHEDDCGRIAGQIDKLWLYWDGLEWWATIGDYKTDKKIEKTPFFMKKTFRGKLEPKTFYYPLTGMYDNTYNTYNLKMSLYAYMMESIGIKIKELFIIHVPKSGGNTTIKFDYLRERVKAMVMA